MSDKIISHYVTLPIILVRVASAYQAAHSDISKPIGTSFVVVLIAQDSILAPPGTFVPGT